MAPRKEYGPPTRRSARQRSASISEAGEEKDAGLSIPPSFSSPVLTRDRVVDIGEPSARVTKPTIPRKAAKASATAWDVGHAVERIAGGDLAYIRRLTHAKRAAIIEAFVSREVDFKSRLEELEAANERLIQERDRALAAARGKRNMHAEAQQARINEKVQQLQKTQSSTSSPAPSVPSAPSSPAVVQELPAATTSPANTKTPTEISVQEQEVTITSATPFSEPEAESTPKLSMWRGYLSAVGGIFSPFKRLGTPQSTKRPAPEDDDEPVSSSKRARKEEPSPRIYCGPAAKDSRLPTSLSTINEFTEPGNSTFIDPTPSKPPQSRANVQEPNLPQTSSPATSEQTAKDTPKQTLPAPSRPNASIQTPTMGPPKRPASAMSQSVPSAAYRSSPESSFLSSEGPRPRRTIASVRAARAAANTPTRQPYSWQRQATPKPNERNADRRLEKLQELREVQQQLEQLQKDADVIEMQSHRRKRVKVDDLQVIPHNLPGDSSGTFRVPDWDSDEEMEVDESVPEIKNVFSTQADQDTSMRDASIRSTEQDTPRQPPAQQAEPQKIIPAKLAENSKEQSAQPAEEEKIDFRFPTMGPRLPEHDISEEESQRLGNVFTASFNEFLRENNYVMGEYGWVQEV